MIRRWAQSEAGGAELGGEIVRHGKFGDIELAPGKMVMFAHGFNIRFGAITVRPDVDVSMIAEARRRGAALGRAPRVDVGDVEHGIDALREQVHGERDDVHVVVGDGR